MKELYDNTKQFFENPSQYNNNRISIIGRIKQKRKLGKALSFIVLQSDLGVIQCIINGTEIKIPALNSIVAIDGIVRNNKNVKCGLPNTEILVEKIKVLSEVEVVPLTINEKSSRALRIKNRHLDLRNQKISAIFKIRSTVLEAFRQFLVENDFLEVSSPKIVGDSVEGSVEAFSVDYFGTKAYLSLSNMLYHMQVIGGDLMRTFEIGPYFRANKSRTNIHLNEFTILDFSAAYFNRDEMIELTNSIITYTLEFVNRNCQEQLQLFSLDWSNLNKFEIITYQELIDYLNDQGFALKWGETTTIPKSALSLISNKFNSFFWIIDQPEESKAFYSRAREDNGKSVCYDCQLWHPRVTDIADGAERIIKTEEALTKIKRRGLNPENFSFYLEVLSHGLPPMTGIGIGVDRFIQLILNLSDIRETVLFPRDSRSKIL